VNLESRPDNLIGLIVHSGNEYNSINTSCK
jgi:hypothetical protein